MEALSPRTEAEAFLKDPYRLACQATLRSTDEAIEFALLRRSPQILAAPEVREVQLDPVVKRSGDQVFYEDEEIDSYRDHIYGLAVDLGTTTVVAPFLDVEDGRIQIRHDREYPTPGDVRLRAH